MDLGESFPTHIFLQHLASIQLRTSFVKFACSPRTYPQGIHPAAFFKISCAPPPSPQDLLDFHTFQPSQPLSAFPLQASRACSPCSRARTASPRQPSATAAASPATRRSWQPRAGATRTASSSSSHTAPTSAPKTIAGMALAKIGNAEIWIHVERAFSCKK